MFSGDGSEHSIVLSDGNIAQIKIIADRAERLLMTFFNGTVRPNHDYVVLLGDSESGTIYVPAAPKLSVFDLSHYDEIKALIA